MFNSNQDGEFTIYPNNKFNPVKAYCKQGWTRILNKIEIKIAIIKFVSLISLITLKID